MTTDPCPHCDGPTEWLMVESVHGDDDEEVLVCHECGELVRRVQLEQDGIDVDFELPLPTDEDYEAWNDYSDLLADRC